MAFRLKYSPEISKLSVKELIELAFEECKKHCPWDGKFIFAGSVVYGHHESRKGEFYNQGYSCGKLFTREELNNRVFNIRWIHGGGITFEFLDVFFDREKWHSEKLDYSLLPDREIY